GMLILEWIQQTFNSVRSALIIVLVFVALRLLVRRTWLAVGIGIVIVAASSNNSVSGQALWLDSGFAVLRISLITYGIFRFGLLVTTVMLLTDNIPSSIPFTGHAAAWATMPGILSAG